jgi:hypothetical protein
MLLVNPDKCPLCVCKYLILLALKFKTVKVCKLSV